MLRGGVVRAFDNDEPSISDFSDTPPASDNQMDELEAAVKTKTKKVNTGQNSAKDTNTVSNSDAQINVATLGAVDSNDEAFMRQREKLV